MRLSFRTVTHHHSPVVALIKRSEYIEQRVRRLANAPRDPMCIMRDDASGVRNLVLVKRDFGDVKCATEGRELLLMLFRQSRNDQNRHLMHRRNFSTARLRFLARHNRAAKTCDQTLRSRRLEM